MPTTFWECYLDNNPESQAQLVELLTPDVISLMSVSQLVETPAGVVDGINDTFTLASIPNPLDSLVLSLISGGVATQQVAPADYSGVVIANVYTIQMTVPPAIGESLQAIYYAV